MFDQPPLVFFTGTGARAPELQTVAPPPYAKKGSGSSVHSTETLLLWPFGAALVPEPEGSQTRP
jgi:hypothetical protein